MQRRPPAVGSRVHVCLSRQQLGHGGAILSLRRGVQERVAAGAPHVHVRAGRQQQLECNRIVRRRVKHGREPVLVVRVHVCPGREQSLEHRGSLVALGGVVQRRSRANAAAGELLSDGEPVEYVGSLRCAGGFNRGPGTSCPDKARDPARVIDAGADVIVV